MFVGISAWIATAFGLAMTKVTVWVMEGLEKQFTYEI